jgi:hypothetical protein
LRFEPRIDAHSREYVCAVRDARVGGTFEVSESRRIDRETIRHFAERESDPVRGDRGPIDLRALAPRDVNSEDHASTSDFFVTQSL